MHSCSGAPPAGTKPSESLAFVTQGPTRVRSRGFPTCHPHVQTGTLPPRCLGHAGRQPLTSPRIHLEFPLCSEPRADHPHQTRRSLKPRVPECVQGPVTKRPLPRAKPEHPGTPGNVCWTGPRLAFSLTPCSALQKVLLKLFEKGAGGVGIGGSRAWGGGRA